MDNTVEAVAQVCNGVDHVFQKFHMITTSSLDPEEVRLIYDHWADQYNKDKDFTAAKEQDIYKTIVEMVLEVCPHPSNTKILDIGAGTGILGLKLIEAGYSNMDAVDASAKMLDVCRKCDIYTNLYASFLGDRPLPIESDSYDLLVSMGSFLNNHITEACFEDLIRITKPGGKFVIAMHCGVGDPEYAEKFLAKMNKLQSEGLWKVKDRKGFQEKVSDFKTSLFSIEKC